MLEQYYNISEAAGISIHIRQDGGMDINACSVAISNKQLHFEKKITGIQVLEDLSNHFPAKTYIALNLSGKGVLQKQITKTEAITKQNFNQILPNAALEDFYVQLFTSGEQSFVSVIRRTEADKYISKLEGLGYIPLILSLGPFAIKNVISQLNIYATEIIFKGYSVQRNEQGDWISVNYNEAFSAPFPLKVESETLDEKLLIPYAAAFQLVLAGKLNPIIAEAEPLAAKAEKVTGERKFKVRGVVILSVFFVLLLINFVVFSWLNSANSKLTEQVSLSVQSTGDLQKTNDQVAQKDSLVKTLGWEGAINKSALIDQVASLLPPDITWGSVAVDPVDLNSSRIKKNVVFFDRKIRITGQSEKIIPVNEWIARVKTRPWVKNVQLDSYAYNSELNTGQFTIVIDY